MNPHTEPKCVQKALKKLDWPRFSYYYTNWQLRTFGEVQNDPKTRWNRHLRNIAKQFGFSILYGTPYGTSNLRKSYPAFYIAEAIKDYWAETTKRFFPDRYKEEEKVYGTLSNTVS